LQLPANVQWEDAAGFLVEKVRGERVIRNRRDQSRIDRVGGRGIVIIKRFFRKITQ